MSLNLTGISEIVESFMNDTLRVSRLAGSDFNEATGQVVERRTKVYEGKAFFGSPSGPSRVKTAQDDVNRVVMEVGFPIACPEILPDDIIEVLACSLDPAMVGKEMRVQGTASGTFSVHRRVIAWMETGHED